MINENSTKKEVLEKVKDYGLALKYASNNIILSAGAVFAEYGEEK